MDKNNYDKGDLKDELKNAGFDKCIADDIADNVDDRKMDNWTQDTARNEALREAQTLLNRTQQAYDNFRQRNMSSTTRETMTRTM